MTNNTSKPHHYKLQQKTFKSMNLDLTNYSLPDVIFFIFWATISLFGIKYNHWQQIQPTPGVVCILNDWFTSSAYKSTKSKIQSLCLKWVLVCSRICFRSEFSTSYYKQLVCQIISDNSSNCLAISKCIVVKWWMNITRRNKKCLLIINDFHKLEPRYTAVACDGMRRPAFNCHYFILIYIINWLYQFVVRKKKINLFLVNIMVMSTGFKTTNNGMV